MKGGTILRAFEEKYMQSKGRDSCLCSGKFPKTEFVLLTTLANGENRLQVLGMD